MRTQDALRNESPARWFTRPSTATAAATPPASEAAADVSVEPHDSVRDAAETEGAEIEGGEIDVVGTPQPAPIAAEEANDAPVDDVAAKKQATRRQTTKKQAAKAAAKTQRAKKDIAKKAPRRRT
jgi:hypothetical protein